jgi:very-short-patch-repair endonuclease
MRTRKISRAREVRHDQTDCEKLLWQRLRRRGVAGLKFRRQHPVGPYVLDFFCDEAGIGIELDGGGHAEPSRRTRDDDRARDLKRLGVRLLRFWNPDVLQNIDGVMERILRAVRPPSP